MNHPFDACSTLEEELKEQGKVIGRFSNHYETNYPRYTAGKPKLQILLTKIYWTATTRNSNLGMFLENIIKALIYDSTI